MRKLTRDDLPWLIALRDAYKKILQAANEEKKGESDIGMLIAFATIIDETNEKLDRTRKDIARLDRAA